MQVRLCAFACTEHGQADGTAQVKHPAPRHITVTTHASQQPLRFVNGKNHSQRPTLSQNYRCPTDRCLIRSTLKNKSENCRMLLHAHKALPPAKQSQQNTPSPRRCASTARTEPRLQARGTPSRQGTVRLLAEAGSAASTTRTEHQQPVDMVLRERVVIGGVG